MDRLSALMEIKYQGLFLQERLVGVDSEKVRTAYNEFQALVDKFYEENSNTVSKPQYSAARDNFDYFMILVEMEINRVREEEERESAG